SLEIRGAREHNLKNISLEIPRDQLVVITGVSGSGKSSLAFDTVYAEGQRRYLDSLSSFVRTFVESVPRPDVDFVDGLSPVVSIGQKTITKSPRSTVGTMTDIGSYLNLLYATTGAAQCPLCDREVPIRSVGQIAEQILSLPAGARAQLRAPVFPIYGEDLSFLFTEIRKKGYRRILIDGCALDISDELEIDESAPHVMQAIIDEVAIKPGIEKSLKASIEAALNVGERYLSLEVTGIEPERATTLFDSFGCPVHHTVMGDLQSIHFLFNDPLSACRTCVGLGTYLQVHPDLLIPDKSRSIAGGAFVQQAFRYNRDTWDGKMMYSLAERYAFSLDAPWRELSPEVVDLLFHGTKGDKFTLLLPPGAKPDDRNIGREIRFDGIITRIERHYRRYRQQQVAHSGMEEYLTKVMVEHRCPDCKGARLRPQRMLVKLGGKSIYELSEMNIFEMRQFVEALPAPARNRAAGQQILRELTNRVDLLLGIGLDYLSLSRKSATLSGGESQRIRLSTQIGSGLMGMLYVLDEPSIGLHPKDNVKLIATLKRLKEIGNTVIVVEHDEDTMRAADHIVEMGPLAGVHGGEVVAQGAVQQIESHPQSLTGQYLSGHRRIAVPSSRRQGNGSRLAIRGARENNLRSIDVEIPLGLFVCVTGASGSGKSTLVNEILFNRLYSHFYDSRVLFGEHDALEGIQNVKDVIKIDQSPIGRNSRSNPATYIGFYDTIRQLFADTPEARERGYTASRFSFNVKGGRCEECAGQGTVTTHLSFMPDVEVLCETCKGKRYDADTLEILFEGKSISDVLEMSIEDGVGFFRQTPPIARKLETLYQLGLGYLTLGQSATTLSGGEAQRVKLASELSKLKRGGRVLYILDEPTTGLHWVDIERLLECLNRLVDAGHTVLVIEHHMDVIKTADYIIDLGPEGGHKGGEVLFCGTPEEIVRVEASYTGRFLGKYLGAASR
ncbi:MAG TPA: excinuclease ABC subunit UvrA, partial [Chthonomonadales bacterium]|nr:excinuclease ABC subunit UvrA [Chthonomonadales bacterium]